MSFSRKICMATFEAHGPFKAFQNASTLMHVVFCDPRHNGQREREGAEATTKIFARIIKDPAVEEEPKSFVSCS